MSGGAMLVMLIAIVLIWGGLVLSVIHLMKNPDIAMEDVKND